MKIKTIILEFSEKEIIEEPHIVETTFNKVLEMLRLHANELIPHHFVTLDMQQPDIGQPTRLLKFEFVEDWSKTRNDNGTDATSTEGSGSTR